MKRLKAVIHSVAIVKCELRFSPSFADEGPQGACQAICSPRGQSDRDVVMMHVEHGLKVLRFLPKLKQQLVEIFDIEV